MTPEQRAAEVVGILGRRGHWLNQEVEDRVAAAIRAAVEAERERCAEVAEEYGVAVNPDAYEAAYVKVAASQIAAAIRNTNAPVDPER